MLGCVVAMVLLSIWFLPKAMLEAWKFHEHREARQTMSFWLISMGCIGLALAFSLLFDHYG